MEELEGGRRKTLGTHMVHGVIVIYNLIGENILMARGVQS